MVGLIKVTAMLNTVTPHLLTLGLARIPDRERRAIFRDSCENVHKISVSMSALAGQRRSYLTAGSVKLTPEVCDTPVPRRALTHQIYSVL